MGLWERAGLQRDGLLGAGKGADGLGKHSHMYRSVHPAIHPFLDIQKEHRNWGRN